MTGKRGRPPGPRQADRKRNLFVYLLVADFMDIGLSRKDAVEVAASLLASVNDPLRRPSAFDKLFVRRTDMAPLWRPGQEQVEVEVEVEGDVISIPIGAMVWMAWERAWQRHADFGVSDRGVTLGAARVGRIYDDLAAEHSVADFVVCPDCGHRNQHNPARDQVFRFGDPCRKCGAGTGDLDSDLDPIQQR